MLNRYINPSWDSFITDEIKSILKEIEKNIGNIYYPEKENVLRFLSCDLNKIKYIIVGMEPYPSDFLENGLIKPVATGRSFELANMYSWTDKIKQTSLRNILKTIYYNQTNKIKDINFIRKEIINNNFIIENPKDWFDEMEKRGVLFLNATLTVKPHEPDSHSKYWDEFMNLLIRFIEKNNKNIMWFLWGKKAQERFIPNLNNNYLCFSHPRINKFVEENCFQYFQ